MRYFTNSARDPNQVVCVFVWAQVELEHRELNGEKLRLRKVGHHEANEYRNTKSKRHQTPLLKGANQRYKDKIRARDKQTLTTS